MLVGSSKPGLPSRFIAVALGFDVRVDVAVCLLAGKAFVFLVCVVVALNILVVVVIDLFGNDVVRVAAETIGDDGRLDASIVDMEIVEEGTSWLSVTDLHGPA